MLSHILLFFIALLHVAHLQESKQQLFSNDNGINSTLPSASISPYGENENQTRLNQFWNSIHQIEANIDKQYIEIADQISQTTRELNQSSLTCYSLIEQAFRTGLHKEWSSKIINSNAFLDSPSSIPNAIIADRFSSLGDFWNCFSLKNASAEVANKQISFDGKYCLASLNTPQIDYYSKAVEKEKFANLTGYFDHLASKWLVVRNRFPLSYGICIPSVCTTNEVNLLIRKYFVKYLEGIDLEVGYCQVAAEGKKFNFGFLLSAFIILLMVTLSTFGAITSRVIHFLQVSSNKVHPEPISTLQSKLNLHFIGQVVNCFNLEHNFQALFSLDQEDGSNFAYDLRWVHGFKAFMLMGTVFAHSSVFISIVLFSKVAAFGRYPSFFNIFQAQIKILNNMMGRMFLVVDFFFVLSGFLVAYLVLSKTKKAPSFLSYVFIRWIRLVPSMIAIICLTIVLQKVGMGPLFHEELTEPYVKPCYDYWWTHILFINNYWTMDQMCGPNMWFIAADFQLHIVLYFIIVIYYRKKILAWITSIGLIVVSAGFFIVANLFGFGHGWPKLDFTLNFQYPAPLDAVRFFYTSFHTHTLAYFFGVLIAFKLIARKTPIPSSNFKDNMVSISLSAFMILFFLPIKAIETELNENKSLSYLLSFMTFFICVNLVQGFCIYYFIVSRKSLLKRILSAKFLIPFGRLSYGIYLINPLMNWHTAQMNWNAVSLTFIYSTTHAMANYFACFIVSLFLYLFFQSPFYNLAQLLIKGTQRPVSSLKMDFTKSHDINANPAWCTENSKEEHTQLRSVSSMNAD